MEAAYTEYKAYSELVDYTSEAFFAVELLNFASGYKKIAALTASDTISTEFYQLEAANFYTNSLNFYSKYYVKIDKELFATMMKLYAENVAPALQSEYFKAEAAKYQNNYTAWADALFGKSVFVSAEKLQKAMGNFNAKKAKKLLNDPAYRLYAEVANRYESQIKSGINPLNEKIGIYMREYMKAQRLMQPDRDIYPDANSTLRVTYGNVKG